MFAISLPVGEGFRSSKLFNIPALLLVIVDFCYASKSLIRPCVTESIPPKW